MKTKVATVLVVLAAFGVGAYWWYSPYLVMQSMRAAAESGDGDRLSQHVDYPKLRESLKGQFSAAMAKEAAKGETNGAALFGAALAAGFVNAMIDNLITPEALRTMFAEGKANFGKDARPGESVEKAPEFSFDRIGSDKLIAAAGEDGAKTVAFVFERSGFATWKLTEI